MAKRGEKHQSVTLKKKLALIRAVESGESKHALTRRTGILRSTITGILNEKSKYIKALEAGTGPKLKRLRNPTYKNIDEALIAWLKIVRSRNLPLSGDILKASFSMVTNFFRERLSNSRS
jgi:hypothetical protein